MTCMSASQQKVSRRYREDLEPVFMLMSEQEQLLAGNAFMRRLAQQVGPTNPALGQRKVIHLMDAGMSLSRHFDMDLASLLPTPNPVRQLHAGHRALTGTEAWMGKRTSILRTSWSCCSPRVGARTGAQASQCMHEICRRQHESGSRDILRPSVGRLAEAEGIKKDRVLYNAQSADYRTLIEAWAAYAGPPAPRPPKALASHEYLMRIEDPAIRSIMQAIIADRDNPIAEHISLKWERRISRAHASAGLPRSRASIRSQRCRLTQPESNVERTCLKSGPTV